MCPLSIGNVNKSHNECESNAIKSLVTLLQQYTHVILSLFNDFNVRWSDMWRVWVVVHNLVRQQITIRWAQHLQPSNCVSPTRRANDTTVRDTDIWTRCIELHFHSSAFLELIQDKLGSAESFISVTVSAKPTSCMSFLLPKQHLACIGVGLRLCHRSVQPFLLCTRYNV